MRKRPDPVRAWARRAAAVVLVLVLGPLAVLLSACTGEPDPTPSPTPTAEETTEPAPSGVEVAVVLPPASDPASASFLEVERQLAELEADRVGEVASVRSVLPDDRTFVADIAALLADEGVDLVCILGSDGPQAVAALADRFPATRFCALAPPREAAPANVDLLDVAHEEIGHALGVAVGRAAADDPVGLVLGDDGEERARRRAGARAALAESDVTLDGIVRDASEAADLAEAADEAEVAALLVDVADAGAATVVAAAAPAWVGPRGVPVDSSAGEALVRWALRADVIVGAAIDRLVAGDEADDGASRLGFADDVFLLTYSGQVPDAVRAATETAATELARGIRDPLGVPGADAPDEPDPAAPAEEPTEGVEEAEG